MKQNKIKQWLINNKKILIIGFIFGALIAPFLATLGLILSFFETLRLLLIGPMDLVSSLIPDVQIGPDTFYAPWYKWVVSLGFNGVCYAFVFWFIKSIISKKQRKRSK